MVLTERQKKELNMAILEYLISEGETFSGTISALRDEAKIIDPPDLTKCLLEKKWTSVVRLQRRVMELEAKISTLQQNSSSNIFRTGGADGAAGGSIDKMLPRAPPRNTLSGHRSVVTGIAIHPKYSIFASCSEDTTIKLWDFETAQ
jgi:platelet-activating factor acetylhydrolase IB subunit alpha